MGKGRAPCCDKSQVKKGPWSPAEDLRLISFIQKHGHENWRALPKQAGLLRCGKSCRLRWINYLRPDVKRGNFTKDEEDSIIQMHQTMGNKWSKIAAHLPGRTDNEIKNVWNTHLKKRLSLKDQDSTGTGADDSSATYSSSSSSTTTTTQKKRVNTENQPDHRHHRHNRRQQRENSNSNALATKKPRVSGEETKEFPANSSSSSNNSNITNCNSSKPADNNQLISLLIDDFSAPDFGHIRNILEEVNKPDQIQEIAAAAEDIPFESDVDFWNMLDGLNPSSLPIEIQLQNEEDDQKINSRHGSCSSNLGEIENKKWLRYLENELGLEAATAVKDGGGRGSILSDGGFEVEMAVPEKLPGVNSDIGYYHLWPSL